MTSTPSPLTPQTQWRTAQIFLFDTCTHKCAYCHFAESGKVLNAAQLNPYRDPEFIRTVTGFFNRRTTDQQKWLLQLSGGEPLLMPNFTLFCDELAAHGNKISLYTAMMIGENQASFRYLIEKGAQVVDNLMCSFHPEAEAFEEEYFRKLKLLKEAGNHVIFRFIGHPKRLGRLNELSDRCREMDIAFYSTPLFSPDYPQAYTDDERGQLMSHVSSMSQYIQLGNGLDTKTTMCHASSRILYVDLRSGNISPCASLEDPIIGNIYDDKMKLVDRPIRCPKAGISCICDAFFQLDIVQGAEDSDAFERQKNGWQESVPAAHFQERLDKAGLKLAKAQPRIGQTQTSEELMLSKEDVKKRFLKNQPYFDTAYRKLFHPEFRQRMLQK